MLRFKHYSLKTEEAYVGWYRQYVRFHGVRHPAEMGGAEVEAFLTHLAVDRKVVAATQNQALNALVFFYREVIKQEFEGVNAMRAAPSKRLPTVLSVDETRKLLEVIQGEEAVICRLLYGCGLRVMECLRLRVKDVDLSGGKVEIRGGKGDKDRVVTLPKSLVTALQDQLKRCRVIYEKDRKEGLAGVFLPGAYQTKNPKAGESWTWFWLFPAERTSQDPRAGELERRHHVHESRVGRALKGAVTLIDLEKRVTAHTLRHSFATHLVLRGVDIRSVQEVMGHTDVRTTMVYVQMAGAMRGAISSPLDDMMS